jgi:ribosomal protein L11 methyltransferase
VSDAAYLRYTLHTRPAAERPAPGARQTERADDPLLAALDHPPAVTALLELPVFGWQESDDALVFWLPAGAERDAVVGPRLAALRRFGEIEVAAEADDWRCSWQRFHQPIAVGELYIRPSWVEPLADSLDIVIDAGLAFGSGTHATTRGCLQALCGLPHGSLFDLGTGSGLLALAALRLGHKPVYAVDNDPVAIAVAEANAAVNGLAPTFVVGDITDPRFSLPQTDAVVANLMLAPILALAQRYSRSAASDALQTSIPRHLILAGLLVEQGNEVVAALPGYVVRERIVLDEWVSLRLERR